MRVVADFYVSRLMARRFAAAPLAYAALLLPHDAASCQRRQRDAATPERLYTSHDATDPPPPCLLRRFAADYFAMPPGAPPLKRRQRY